MADERIPVVKEFARGDTDTTEDYDITRVRAVVPLTGYDPPKLYARNMTSGTNVGPITGSIPDAANGRVRFDHDLIAANDGDYTCEVELIHPSNGARAIRRWFRIIVRKRVHDLTS